MEAVIGESGTLKPDNLARTSLRNVNNQLQRIPAFSGAQVPQPEQRTWEEVQDLGVTVEAHMAALYLQPLLQIPPCASSYWELSAHTTWFPASAFAHAASSVEDVVSV